MECNHSSFPWQIVLAESDGPAVCPITQSGGEHAALRSEHASRGHDAEQLYVNVQDSFSCAETVGVGVEAG